MEHVIAERVFPEPVDLEALLAAVQSGASCLQSYRVRHLRSCVSLDGRRMVCEYEAPDAESVRVVSRRLGIPYERVWTVKLVYAPPNGELEPTPAK